MRRREFITLFGGAAALWPLPARAQQAERMRRVGVLLPAAADDQAWQAWVGAFLQALGELGWTIGRNVRIDTRWAGANAAEIRRHAAELAALALPAGFLVANQVILEHHDPPQLVGRHGVGTRGCRHGVHSSRSRSGITHAVGGAGLIRSVAVF